jgi:hypothetical protein
MFKAVLNYFRPKAKLPDPELLELEATLELQHAIMERALTEYPKAIKYIKSINNNHHRSYAWLMAFKIVNKLDRHIIRYEDYYLIERTAEAYNKKLKKLISI